MRDPRVAARAYLDYNATAPLRPLVRQEMIEALDAIGNPSSIHAEGQKSRYLIEESRSKIKDVLGVKKGEIVFTSGGTEGNNMVLKGVESESSVVSGIEHESVLGVREDSVACSALKSGVIDLDRLERLLKEMKSPPLVSVMLVNNETGVIQPIEEVISIVRRYGGLIHCDATQGVGRLEKRLGELDLDYAVFSGHKLGGPKGIGCVLVNRREGFSALLKGGGQEKRLRGGTENVSSIVGLRVAVEESIGEMGVAMPRLEGWRDRLEDRIRREVPGAMIFGGEAERVGNTSCIGVRSWKGYSQVIGLDLLGISVSSGSACTSGKVSPSHVLESMGVEAELLECVIRVSLGWKTTADEVEYFCSMWPRLYWKGVEGCA